MELNKITKIEKLTSIPPDVYLELESTYLNLFTFAIPRKLNKMDMSYGDDWDEYLDLAMFSMRQERQRSIKYSPFEVMYGRKMTLPSEAK